MSFQSQQVRTIQNRNAPQPADPTFACIRCWRLKKKCDKNFPQCIRCSTAGISCIYSDQAPTSRKSVARDRTVAAARSSMAEIQAEPQKLDFTTSHLFLSSSQNLPSATLDATDNFFFAQSQALSKLTAPIYTPFHAIKREIGEVLQSYLETINTWIPIIPESQVPQLENVTSELSAPDAEICTLLLAIYLVTTQPDNGVGLDELYAGLKIFHSNLYTISTDSVLIIQTGMLLAIYEQGQALHQQSYLTIGACVRLAQAVGMQLSLKKEIELNLPSGGEMQMQRHIWWCLVILERILSLSYVEDAPPQASPDPELFDYLPSYWPFSSAPDVAVPVGSFSNDYTLYPEIVFSSTSSMGQSVQAIYLLSQVLKHTSTQHQSSELRQADAEYLHSSVMALMTTTMRKVTNEDGKWQHSCIPMYVIVCTLMRLHTHTLEHTSYTLSPLSQRSIMTLQMATRVATSSLDGSNVSPQKKLHASLANPAYMLAGMRDIVLVSAKMARQRNGFGDGYWMELIEFYRNSFEAIGRKWRLGGEYMEGLRREMEGL